MAKIQVYPTPQALAEAAASQLRELAAKSILKREKFNVVLAGGNTPRRLYERLAQAPYRIDVDWAKVEVFFGDERCVSPDDPESNYRMARESLLANVAVPERQIHRMRGEIAPAQAAASYEAELMAIFGGSIPEYDLVILGLGEDGHTASLFPGSAALDERKHWVAAVKHTSPPQPLVPRITLTLPVLNAAREVWFLVSGTTKAKILNRIMDVKEDSELLPAQRVQPASGELIYLVDEAAYPEGR